MNFLFWNTKGRALTANVARMAAASLPNGSEVVFLAESGAAGPAMTAALNAATGSHYRHLQLPGCLIDTYTRLAPANFRLVFQSKRYVIWRLRTNKAGVVLATAVHLPSRLRYTESTQRRVSSDLAEEISKAERRCGNVASFIIGDANMNPFAPGMIEADALNAVCSQVIASQITRKVNGKRYKMFYSPMWSHMGDSIAPPPGTFYRRSTDNDCIFFHTLDQVLVRPELIDAFNQGGLRIWADDGVDQFVSAQHIPRKNQFSDHLPISLELDL